MIDIIHFIKNGLLRRSASRKDEGIWIASSLRFSQRRGYLDCFVAPLLAKTRVFGLLRRSASRKDEGIWIASSLRFSQRRGRMDCFVAALLAKTGATRCAQGHTQVRGVSSRFHMPVVRQA